MEEITGQQEIWDMHKEWAEKHFHADKAREIPVQEKIKINIE